MGLNFYNALESDWLAAFIHDQDIGYPQRQYKMIVRSHNGPIDLYLLRYVYYVIWHACDCKYLQILEFVWGFLEFFAPPTSSVGGF